jgi:hypothetical protein
MNTRIPTSTNREIASSRIGFKPNASMPPATSKASASATADPHVETSLVIRTLPMASAPRSYFRRRAPGRASLPGLEPSGQYFRPPASRDDSTAVCRRYFSQPFHLAPDSTMRSSAYFPSSPRRSAQDAPADQQEP